MLKAIEFIDEFGPSLQCGEDKDKPHKKTPTIGAPIPHTEVLEISRRLSRIAEKRSDDRLQPLPLYRLDDLLRGSYVYIEPPTPKAEPTSEYKKLMARLRREEETKAYERMINPLPPAETFAQRFPGSQSAHLFPTSQADIGEDDEISYADVNRQMALLANVLISILACSIAIWIAARYWSTPARLALSMGGSTLVGAAEVVVYTTYLERLKNARAKARKEIETKRIIKTWVIGSEEDKPGQDRPVPISSRQPYDDALRRRRPKQT